MSKYGTGEPEALARMLKAISNPHRLRMLMRLAKHCPSGGACCDVGSAGRCVGEIARGLGVSASTVSHHLKELRNAGLITMARRGRTIECAVNEASLREIETFFSSLFQRPPSGKTSEKKDSGRERK